jgi:tetratricopeptide (TPR) repeat protein
MDAIAEDLIARLRRNPEDHAAYAALRAHYQRLGDYPSLINLLEGWAGRSPDHAASAQALFDAGEIAWGLADAGRAATLYEKALDRNPSHGDAWARLEQLLEGAQDGARLAQQMEKRAEGLVRIGADPREAAALHHRLGELWEQRFARVDKAILHYRKAFELDGGLVPAIYAAREIYRKAGNLKAAASLLELEAKAEGDADRRLALLRELAHLRAEGLGDLEGAISALKRALTQAPQSDEVMEELAQLYLARAERGTDPRVQDSDQKRAADVLVQLAQRLPPARSVPLLGQALDAAPDHEPALALLERIAEHVGDPRLLPGRWVAFLARAPEAPGARERRRRLAHAYLEAGQTDYAISCLEWLLDEGDAAAADELAPLYRAAGRTDDLLRALAVAAAPLPAAQRLPRLRERTALLVADGRLAEAVQEARAILALAPDDADAFALLEQDCARRGAWQELLAAHQQAAGAEGASTAFRQHHLRALARLGEERAGDLSAALAAYRALSALDPSDRDALAQSARLLEASEQWDELAAVLESQVRAEVELGPRVELLRRLAHLHRHQRNDPTAAAAVLAHLLELVPRDRAAESALGRVLVLAGRVEEALYYLEADVQHAPPGARRAEALRAVGRAHDALEDPVSAYDAWARLLEDAAGDREALGRMEEIDAAPGGDGERLLRTLGYRAEIEVGEEKAAVLVRMGRLAEQLGELDRAAEIYARALEVTPRSEALLDDLCRVYDRAERYKDLVVLLRERALTEVDGAVRAALWRRVARTLAERVEHPAAASEAWLKVLDEGEDREALEFLRARAEERGDLAEAETWLARIAAVATDPADKRDVMRARARMLAEHLERPRDAIAVLRDVVRSVDPHHLVSLGELGDLEEAVGDLAGQADTLERTLAVLDDDGLRVPIARRLAGLCEDELGQPERAIDALGAWSEADLADPEPLRRLVPLQRAAARWPALLATYDALADIEDDDVAVSEAVRAGAEVAHLQLGDVDGAWDRLVPRVTLGDAAAEAQLVALAESARRGPQLADYYAELAGQGDDPLQQSRRWMDSAAARERLAGDPAGALEAVLKALALDLGSERCLAEADRLAARAAAFPRLAQVYETLLRKTEDKVGKKRLLLRHGAILEGPGRDASAALDRVLRAAALDPSDDTVLAEAERLAHAAGRAEELLIAYDRRRKEAADDAGRIEALLRAAALAHGSLDDAAQVALFLGQAVALTVRAPALAPLVEDGVRAAPGRSLVPSLVEVYAALAEGMDADPVGASRLLVRAAGLLAAELGDEPSAYGALVRASSLAPEDEDALEALTRFAEKSGRLGPLEQHLGRLVEDVLDGKVAARLLRRRATLLAQLGRKGDAAEAWGRIKTLQPADEEVRQRWRQALREAGRHEDVLLALDQEIGRNKDRATHAPLRREQARIWERDLRNRSEALDAWKKVLALDPDDAEAIEAVARLGARRPSLVPEGPSSDEIALPPRAARPARAIAAAEAAESFEAVTRPSAQALGPAEAPRAAVELEDAESAEAESLDAESGDAESLDAESLDAEPGDAESLDAESLDAESGDAESLDAESLDAESLDAESGDAESGDAESGDAESLDAESGDAELFGTAEPRAARQDDPAAAAAPAPPADEDDERDTAERLAPLPLAPAPFGPLVPTEDAAPPAGDEPPRFVPPPAVFAAPPSAPELPRHDAYADDTVLADDAAREQEAELDDVVSHAKMPPVASFGLAGTPTGELDVGDLSDVEPVDDEEDDVEEDDVEEDDVEEDDVEDASEELEELDVPSAMPRRPPPLRSAPPPPLASSRPPAPPRPPASASRPGPPAPPPLSRPAPPAPPRSVPPRPPRR